MYEYTREESADGTLFAFNTIHGLSFYVSFTNMQVATYPLSKLYSLDFAEIDGIKSPTDALISVTILNIIITFVTENNDYIVHYICDSVDNKHNFRERLFSKWFCLNDTGNFVKFKIDYEELDYKLFFLYDSTFYEPSYIESEILLTIDSLNRDKV